MAKAFRFLFPYVSYQMVNDLVETHTRTELYREYTRMRTEANKRLERLGKSAYRNTQIYLQNREGFRGGSRLNKSELARGMADMARFLGRKASTVEGAREIKRKAIETFREDWGFDWVNWRNYDQWVDFLDKAKGGKNNPYEIDEIAQLFRSAKKEKIDLQEVLDNFNEYKKQLDLTEELVKLKRPAGSASTSQQLRKSAGRKKAKKGKK